MTVSNSTNGFFAVVEAMANADAAGFNAQRASINDLSSAAFMEGLQRVLSDCGNDPKAVESFLQNYMAGHATGEARDRLATQGALLLPALELMVGKLKDFDAKIKDAQSKCDQDVSDVDSLKKQMDSAKSEADKSEADWQKYYLAKCAKEMPLAFLCPATYVTILVLAQTSYASAQADYGNAAGKWGTALANQTADQTKLSGLQKGQLACATGTTGSIGNHASGLSGPAHSVMQTTNQLTALSFNFVQSLQDSNTNSNE
ncbi:MAG: hypothetical protein ACHQT8_07800 [Chlamydiales bacterium]